MTSLRSSAARARSRALAATRARSKSDPTHSSLPVSADSIGLRQIGHGQIGRVAMLRAAIAQALAHRVALLVVTGPRLAVTVRASMIAAGIASLSKVATHVRRALIAHRWTQPLQASHSILWM